MERIISILEELKKINQTYGISIDYIEGLEQDIICAKVCTPIIGKFSSGKSALVNTILGYSKKIQKEDITPETSIPAEIVYTAKEDIVTIFRNDGSHKELSVNEYRTYEADANTDTRVRIQLKNSFLEEIPNVMLVDMPGFDSGFEIHNKAIDNYLPQSLAFIIAFPADDMIVRSSIGNILKELCLHDIPLCVVITKYDKKNDDFDETFAKMKERLQCVLGDREICYCITNSFTGDAEELEEFLKEIQNNSQDILVHSFINSVLSEMDITENYLKTTLNGSMLSESELDEKEDKLNKQLLSLSSNFLKEQNEFNLEISDCVEEIKNDIQCALEKEEPTLVTMAMNKQDINEQINLIVRKAATVSVQKRFNPKVEKYCKNITDCCNEESIDDLHVTLNFDAEQLNKKMTSAIVAVAAGIFIGFSVFDILLAFIINKIQNDKKREDAKQQIHMELKNKIFPEVLVKVEKGIESTIKNQIELVNSSIEAEINVQKDTLEKAIADVRIQMNDEKSAKETLAVSIRSDIEKIGEIINALQ